MNLKIIAGTLGLVGVYFLLTSATTKKKKLKLLFIGDSNTDNPYSYADKIKEKFPNYEVKKIAKKGEGTKWMLENLTNDLKENKYDIITFLGGSNDVYGGYPLEKTKQNILNIQKLIKNNGAKSVLVTPPNKKFFPENTLQKLKNLDTLIAWEKEQDFDHIIDFFEMTDKLDLFNADFRHPNTKAHDILADVYIKSTGIA